MEEKPRDIAARAQKIFLPAAAAVVAHGAALVVFPGGRFEPERLMYYTVMSNVLLALGFVALALARPDGRARPWVSLGVLLPILVTGIVYNLALVPVAGAAPFFSDYSNFVTHFLSMVLALANYFVFEKKGLLGWRHVPAALAFTFAYWAVFMAIGPAIGFQPYFFMRPQEVGWLLVMAFFLGMLALLLGLSYLLLRHDRAAGARVREMRVRVREIRGRRG